MTLALPKLDDRQFQDIVDEAKKRIPYHCQEWTDHNVSDPGITLIELFAWMTDLILYRLNRIPERHYLEFLNLLGLKLHEPLPAKIPITFWLAKAAEIDHDISAGTEVASTQTETERPVIFSIDVKFTIQPPQWVALMSRKAGHFDETLNLDLLKNGYSEEERRADKWPAIFSEKPQLGDALYFGFKNNLSHHLLRFDFDFDPAAASGIDPTLPPYVWEASTGKEDTRWEPCEVAEDTTQGMNETGHIQLYLPEMGPSAPNPNKEEHYWVRVRVKEISGQEDMNGMKPFDKTPRLGKVAVSSWGGTVMATHAQKIPLEILGYSDGTPGQRFFLQARPILKRQNGETLIVQAEGELSWQEKPDFAESGPTDRHYTLDSITGELRFGPAVRQRNGEVHCYGAIPPRGARLIFTQYRYGGGVAGNVKPGKLNTLKTAIPYVARVENRAGPIEPGFEAETLEEAMVRAPGMLRSRERAVTREDFKLLVEQNRTFAPLFSRVECVQPNPEEAGPEAAGLVHVLVIPTILNPAGRLTAKQLEPDKDDIAKLENYLDERRLLTTRLKVGSPEYKSVAVKVKLQTILGVEPRKVEEEVLNRLYRFLNPLTGGQDGKGWPMGQDLLLADVYQCLQGLAHVQFIRGVELFEADDDGRPVGQAVETVEVIGHEMIMSGLHTVEIVSKINRG
jgi:predicted phage baseplate assembly protein